MKKRPKPAAKKVLFSGGAVRGLGPVPVGLRKPPPRRRHRNPPRLQPGGPVVGLGPVPAKKKKPVRRKLAAPGDSCVLDACYAIAGCRPDLDSEDGLLIPDALEVLGILGLIADFWPFDLDSDLNHSGLILGVDLPGPHAVLVTPDGWWSWDELYDPASFPDAVVEEAWEVTWPR